VTIFPSRSQSATGEHLSHSEVSTTNIFIFSEEAPSTARENAQGRHLGFSFWLGRLASRPLAAFPLGRRRRFLGWRREQLLAESLERRLVDLFDAEMVDRGRDVDVAGEHQIEGVFAARLGETAIGTTWWISRLRRISQTKKRSDRQLFVMELGVFCRASQKYVLVNLFGSGDVVQADFMRLDRLEVCLFFSRRFYLECCSRRESYLQQIPDPRGRQGRRFALSAMLATIVCSTLCGCRGYAAIAQWIHLQDPELWHLLGFTRRPPTRNAFRDLLLALPPELLEEAVKCWITDILPESQANEFFVVKDNQPSLKEAIAAEFQAAPGSSKIGPLYRTKTTRFA